MSAQPAVGEPARRAAAVWTDAAVVTAAVLTVGAAWWSPPVPFTVGLAAAAVAAVVARRRPVALAVGIAVLAAALGHRAWTDLQPPVSRAVATTVRLVTDPEVVPAGTRAIIDLDGQRVELWARGSAARVLRPRLAGEHVAVRGALHPLTPSEVRRRVSQRLVASLDASEVVVADSGSMPWRAANAVRRALVAGASPLAPQRRALYTGLVLGDDRDQTPALRDAFDAAGLTHLLAVSGQNVAFVLAAASPLLRRLRLWPRFSAVVALLGFFALVTRFEPSVLRAVGMAALAALAATLGRPTSGVRVLALTVTALVLLDPFIVHSLGFQLSVAATAGLVVLAPPLAQLARRARLPASVATALSVPLAAQLATGPLLMAGGRPVPLVSLPANVLAEPAAGFVMTWGSSVGLLAGLVPPIAGIAQLPTRLALWWTASVADAALAASMAHLPPSLLFVGLGGAAALAAQRARGRSGERAEDRGGGRGERRARVVVVVVVVAVAGTVAVASAATGFVTAGVAAALPAGAQLWSDHGSAVLVVSRPVDGGRLLIGLRRRHIERLDLVAVTSSAAATWRGAQPVLDRYHPAVLLALPGSHAGSEPVQAGSRFEVGAWSVTVTSAWPKLKVEVAQIAPPADFSRPTSRVAQPPARGPPMGPPGTPEAVPLGGRGAEPASRRVRPRSPLRGRTRGRDHGAAPRYPRRCCEDRSTFDERALPKAAPMSRAAQRSSAAPVTLVRGDEPVLVRDAIVRLVEELLGDADRSLAVTEFAGEEYELSALIDAAQTTPFLTDRRVVVGRDLHRFKAPELAPLVRYLDQPLDTTRLVLAWTDGRVPKALTDAVAAAGGTVVQTSPDSGRTGRRDWFDAQYRRAAVTLDAAARRVLEARVGEGVERVPAILQTLAGVYGPGAKLSAADIEDYLGEAGSVPPWELTDAIDGGNVAEAVERLHRTLGAGDRHPLQVMATLTNHFERMLALSGSGARNEREAADVLGMKGSTFPARKALEGSRRLGPAKLTRAVELLADADLDLRGASAWSPELVMDVLVARLAQLNR